MPSKKARIRRQLLQLSGRLLQRRQPQADHWAPKHILVIRPDHLGDILWLAPALHLLRQQLPAARITVAIGPWSKPILAENPDYDQLLTLDFPGFTRQPKGNPLSPYQLLEKTARQWQAQQFDTALIMRDDHWWGALLAARIGIPRRFGFAQADVLPFLTDSLPLPTAEHAAVGNLRLVEAVVQAAGGEPAIARTLPTTALPLQYPLRFQPSEPAQQHAAHLLHDVANRGPLVAIHPSAGVPVKLWDEGRLAAVAKHLITAYGATIILTGSAGDAALTNAVAAALPPDMVLNLTGQTDVGQLIALYRHCALVIGPDSGALHMAVAAGVPTIHLYGPADPQRFGPWGDLQRQRVIHAGMHCIHCGDLTPTRPRGAACMLAISVADVLTVVAELLPTAVPR